MEDIEGIVDKGAEDKMEIKPPSSGDLYGKRSVPRRKANAKEMDAYKESIKAVTAVIPLDFIETKDMMRCEKEPKTKHLFTVYFNSLKNNLR